MAKPSIRNLVTDLASTLREEVRPRLGGHAGRAHSGSAEGGDVTFEIDEHAERRMEAFLGERAPEVAFYSEDRGMVSPAGDRAEWVLIVDPIDGTRPALAGLESSCVSVAAARLDGEPTMADVQVGMRPRAEERGGVRRRARLGPRAGGPALGERLAGADVLDLRLPWASRAGTGGGAGRADRPLVGRGRHLRPRLSHLRHDARRHRPARCLHRARAADDRRRARGPRRVRAGRRRGRPQQLAV